MIWLTFWLSAAAITLSAFAVAATVLSALVGLAAPLLARRAGRYAPASRAALLFWLRVLPAAGAALGAVAIALPIYLWFEPRNNGDEVFGRTLMVASFAGAVLLARGASRAVAAWRATGVLRRDWQARGRRMPGFDAPMPVFAIQESFPMVAVVGFSRPALFIAERVLAECSGDEVRAMVRHECAHVTHGDNVKRLLIRACPDALRPGPLDRAWMRATEEAADARAAGSDRDFALELAQALIHVARLAPRPRTLEVASAFYLGDSIEARVRQLVEPSASLPDPSRPLGPVLACATAVAFAALIVVAAPAIYQAMEAVVRVLP